MLKTRASARAVLSTLLVLLLVIPGTARQQPTGSVFGIITDLTGEGLPGARVVLVDADDRARQVVTNQLGRFRIDQLPPGRYRIEASMSRFETKMGAISVVAGQVADWSGALLTAPPVFESPIEPRVRKHTGWNVVDCGRRPANAEPRHLEKSLACIVESAKQQRPAGVIVQSMTPDLRGGYGLLTGSDGVIWHFRYGSARLELHLRRCDSPRVVPDHQRAVFTFACE